MAKKKSKKKTASKKTAASVTPLVGESLPDVAPVAEDTRVSGLEALIETVEAYELGDMQERFATPMGKLATEIASVAKRLAKALDVQAVANKKKAVLKAKLLARAEAL